MIEINAKKTALLFPGQGSQSIKMGKDLAQNFACAKEVFSEVNDILGYDLSQIMFEGPQETLTQTENTQPALMAVSIALTTIIEKEFGKKITDLCAFVAGHSLGEYSALCAAKSLTLQETAKLLYIRGTAMANCGKTSDGAMAAILGVDIAVADEIAKEAAQGEVCNVANDNSVGQIVISGNKNAINRALEIAKAKGAKRAIALPVSGAFHSPLMAQAAQKMQQALASATIATPIVPLIANVTANITSDANEIRSLLAQQVTGSVRWRETMLLLEQQGIEQIIEIGSGKVLCGLVPRTCPNIKTISIQNCEDLNSIFA